MKSYNGVSIYDVRPAEHQIFLAVSLLGLGAVMIRVCTTCPFLYDYKGYDIFHLERINCIVALKVGGPVWAYKKIHLCYDNRVVVDVLTSGRARDPILASCTRNVWLLTAIFNI